MKVDASFTGSVSGTEPSKVFHARMPFRVRVTYVDDYVDGKVIERYYKWDVYLQERHIGGNGVFDGHRAHTAAEAFKAGRKFIREYCENQQEITCG